MQRGLGEVLENEDHIKLLQTELDTFQRRHLDISKRDDEEWRVREVHKAFRRRLKADIGAERNTLERQFSEGNIKIECIAQLIFI